MDNKLKGLLKRKLIIEILFNRIKDYVNTIPFLEKELERTKWEIDALENIPVEARDFPTYQILNNIEEETKLLKLGIKLPPVINQEELSLYSVTSGTASSDVFEFVSKVGDIDSPITKKYSLVYSESYKSFQNKYDLVEEINQKLSNLNFSNTQVRFNDAFNSLQRYKNGILSETSTAIEIRTFLDGLKGDLFELAKNHHNENMTLDILGNRLSSIYGIPSINQTIINNLFKLGSLKNRLSEIGKDRVKSSIVNLESIWVEVLDLTNSLLNIAILYKQ